MTEGDVETILQRARECCLDACPQFIAGDFKEFIRLCGITHVRTSPSYPQSNGKIERFTDRSNPSAFAPACRYRWVNARMLVTNYVNYCKDTRLHSSIGYGTPADKLAEGFPAIITERAPKLATAREKRHAAREASRTAV